MFTFCQQNNTITLRGQTFSPFSSFPFPFPPIPSIDPINGSPTPGSPWKRKLDVSGYQVRDRSFCPIWNVKTRKKHVKKLQSTDYRSIVNPNSANQEPVDPLSSLIPWANIFPSRKVFSELLSIFKALLFKIPYGIHCQSSSLISYLTVLA